MCANIRHRCLAHPSLVNTLLINGKADVSACDPVTTHVDVQTASSSTLLTLLLVKPVAEMFENVNCPSPDAPVPVVPERPEPLLEVFSVLVML